MAVRFMGVAWLDHLTPQKSRLHLNGGLAPTLLFRQDWQTLR